jgi:hypothetical protein
LEHETRPSLSPQKPSGLLRLLHTLSSFLTLIWSKVPSASKDKANTHQQERQTQAADQESKDKIISDSLSRDAGKNNAEHGENNTHARKKPFSVRALLFVCRRWKWTKGPNWAEKTTVIVTIGIFAASLIQAWIYWQQSLIMRAQVEQTERSVILGIGQLNSSRQALESSREAFQIDQRPYLVVDEKFPQFYQHGPIQDQKIEVNVQMKNLCKTPAVRVLSNVHLFKLRGKLRAKLTREQLNRATEEYIRALESKFTDMRDREQAARKEIAELEKRNISPGQDVAPQKTYFMTSPDDVTLSKDEMEFLNTNGIVALYLVGLVTYTDAYNNRVYTTELCSFYFGTDPTTWHFCDSHNANR